ncbi:MAG: 4Fe-4S dicluster domain-containing protein [Desulfoplanes sp.]|nr:4Fe-4S dicluster domain-containing protein [Desulfoplanes sp.]
MPKAFLVDLSRCTACRGCQIACKQWHKLPAEKTKNVGSYQNPQDLSFTTYKLVRYSEHDVQDSVKWLFFPEQCRHCIDPPCKGMADDYDERAIVQDPETGAVIFTDFTKKIGDLNPEELCPYNIPRRDPITGIWSKCDMCLDRVQNGLLPACVQACPTGTMNFGEREDMLALAEKRLTELKKKYPDAQLLDPDDVSTIYLSIYPPSWYHKFAVASAKQPHTMNRAQALAKIFPALKHRVG